MKQMRLLLALTMLLSPALVSHARQDGVAAANGGGGQSVSRTQRIEQAADAMRAQLSARRRDFHAHPELSNREARTAGVVAERLRELKFDEVKTNVARHGVVGVLKGGKPGPVVAFRADMDALPINETLDVPYKSLTPNVKHACGHDAHTSVALGVAEVLAGMRAEIAGTIKFIFQPAEEGPPAGEEGGAALMIKEGALDNPRPAAIFGLHALPDIEVGEIAYTSGAMMASSDRFTITIRGKQSHGAQPHEGIDSVVVAAEYVMALQTIRSRRIDPLVPMVISVGIVQGGNRFNIIAPEVKLEGTIRTLNETVRTRAKELMKTTLQSVTSGYGATFDIKFEENAAVVDNHAQLVEQTLPTMRRLLGDKNVFTRPPQMIAEDFSYFQRETPGFYFFLGVGNRAKGVTAKLHTAEFDIDEESMVVGVKVVSNVLLDYLDRK